MRKKAVEHTFKTGGLSTYTGTDTIKKNIEISIPKRHFTR